MESSPLALVQHLVNGLTLGGIYALIALGYTMVYGILKFINFAHGEIMMSGTFIGLLSYNAMRGMPGLDAPPGMGVEAALLPFFLSLLCAMAFSAALGVTVERLAYRPLRKATRLAPLLSAIGVSIILMNLAAMVFGTKSHRYEYPFDNKPFLIGGENGLAITPHQILILGVTIVLMVGLKLFVDRTRMGKAMRATSQDFDTARLMGINADTVISLTFAIGSALGAVAGVLIALDYKAYPTLGTLAGLKAFVAAVLGGIGSIPGAMLGGLILGIMETVGFTLLSAGLVALLGLWGIPFEGIPLGFKDAIAFILLIILLLVKPSGIMGKQLREKV